MKHSSCYLKSPQTTLHIIKCHNGRSKAHLAVSLERVSSRAPLRELISHFTMGLYGSSYDYVALILLSRTHHQLLASYLLCLHLNFVNNIFVISRLITKFTKILCHENLELYGMAFYIFCVILLLFPVSL